MNIDDKLDWVETDSLDDSLTLGRKTEWQVNYDGWKPLGSLYMDYFIRCKVRTTLNIEFRYLPRIKELRKS